MMVYIVQSHVDLGCAPDIVMAFTDPKQGRDCFTMSVKGVADEHGVEVTDEYLESLPESFDDYEMENFRTTWSCVDNEGISHTIEFYNQFAGE